MRTRVQRGILRQDLKRGAVAIEDVLSNPPECLRGALLFDMILMAPRSGLARLERIGGEAIAARVNLAQPLHKTPASARMWLAGRLRRPARRAR
jgi:hypothetical protein